jgi:hypothetical protein
MVVWIELTPWPEREYSLSRRARLGEDAAPGPVSPATAERRCAAHLNSDAPEAILLVGSEVNWSV